MTDTYRVWGGQEREITGNRATLCLRISIFSISEECADDFPVAIDPYSVFVLIGSAIAARNFRSSRADDMA